MNDEEFVKACSHGMMKMKEYGLTETFITRAAVSDIKDYIKNRRDEDVQS